jgi:CHAT domain-containing protein/tetratricopeptide (TPR) repeat protein
MVRRSGLTTSVAWLACTAFFGLSGLAAGDEPPPRKPAAESPLQAADPRLAEAERLDAEVVELYRQGRYREATQKAQGALAIHKQVQGERHRDTAASLNNLAMLLQAQGDYAGARPLYEQALAINKEVQGERHRDTVTSLNNLAGLLEAQGDYAGARPLFEQALAIRKEVLGERHPDTARSLNNLAALLSAQGDYAGARPLYEQALAIRKQILGEQHPDTAASLNNLAALLYSEGDYAGARPLFEQALAIHKQVPGERHPLTARSLNNLAMLLKAQGDYVGARALYKQALDILKQALGERHPLTANSLNNLAELLSAQGDFAGARPLYEQALAIHKEVLGERHPDTAASLNNLAKLFESQGDFAGARPLYEQALAIHKQVLGERHPHTATSLSNVAALLWAQGDLIQAESLLKQGLMIERGNLELAAAVQSERQQLAMAQQLRFTLDAYLSLCEAADRPAEQAYSHVLAWKGAVFVHQRAGRALRRLSLASRHPVVVAAAAKLQDTARELAKLALAVPEPAQREAWIGRVAELGGRKDRLEGALMRRSVEFRVQRAIAEVTAAQVQAALPAESALVDLLEYDHYSPPARPGDPPRWELRLAAFVVRPGRSVARIDLGPAASIACNVDCYLESIRGGAARAAEDPSAAELRRRLWEPLRPHLEGVRLVLVSPDGPLCRLPLAALPGQKEGTYLLEDVSIAIVPVPQYLPELIAAGGPGEEREPEPRRPSLLLVGDVNFGADPGVPARLALNRAAATPDRTGAWARFDPLPATRGEILGVKDSFEQAIPGAPVVERRQGQATEEEIRRLAPEHRYLHLATHGFFAPDGLRSALGPEPTRGGAPRRIDPFGGHGVTGFHPGLLSGLALAGANRPPEPGRDDGILTALEVAELDLSGVDLAVLSACETGLGESAGGEGLLGLQRAFQVAGARSVVASFWTINDARTRDLMEQFYENLWQKKLPPVDALREAQLGMLGEQRRMLKDLDPVERRQRQPPLYWAAFVLSGDWRR